MAGTTTDEVVIGKFDILATYTYARARLDGAAEDEAKERGMVAAVMGARNRLGRRAGHADDFAAVKQAAEASKKTTITADAFDRQVRRKLGAFFDAEFLPALTDLVRDGLSYDEVKRLLRIPPTWGAKIRAGQFRERVSSRKRAGRGGQKTA